MTRFAFTTALLALLIIGPAVTYADVPAIQQYRGFVEPSKYVVINAPLDGILESIAVDENDIVEQGQVIAQMDSKIQEARVEAAKIQADYKPQIESAETELALQELKLKQSLELLKNNAANEMEVEEQRVRRDQAKAQVDAAYLQRDYNRADLKMEEETLARYSIKAPFAGIVRQCIVEAGSTLTNDDQMIELVNLDPLEAKVNLPIELYGRVTQGQQYTLIAEKEMHEFLNKTDLVTDGKIIATLKTIDRVIDSSSGTFRCIFTIDNPGTQLPGGFAVSFIWPQ